MRDYSQLRLALLGIVLGGCTPLTPIHGQAVRDAQTFIDATTAAYGIHPVLVIERPLPPSVGATFERGTITLNEAVLTSPFLDVLIAHELAHAVLGHNHRD
jgi:hypothetical protein